MADLDEVNELDNSVLSLVVGGGGASGSKGGEVAGGGKRSLVGADGTVGKPLSQIEAKLRKLQRDMEPMVYLSNELYAAVTKLARDYEVCVNTMSRQLLALG